MNTKEALQRFEDTARHYMNELDQFSMEQLKRKPSEDEWSIGQMVQHLIQSALYMHLRHIEQCLKPSEEDTSSPAGKTELGAAIFEQGSYPPIRIQVPPSTQYTPMQPESKEQLIQGLNTVIKRMKEVEPTLEKATVRNTVAHVKFGALHAEEWFLLIEMHYRHHLRQWDRLKKFVFANGVEENV